MSSTSSNNNSTIAATDSSETQSDVLRNVLSNIKPDDPNDPEDVLAVVSTKLSILETGEAQTNEEEVVSPYGGKIELDEKTLREKEEQKKLKIQVSIRNYSFITIG